MGTIVEEVPAPSPTATVKVVLYQALSQGAKWDWLVEKACEVGVSRIVPVLTVRTLVKVSEAHVHEKLIRWQRIALAATKQCGRADTMQVDTPMSFVKAIANRGPDSLSLIPWEKESEWSVQQACQGFTGTQINLFIGPEGGWDPQEVTWAEEAGIVPVRLGPTLLRTETAGLIASTLVLRELGIY